MVNEPKRSDWNTVRKRYSVEQVVIDSSNVKKFEVLENRRRIRSGMVRDIYTSLTKGVHFVLPIIVNQRNGNYRILDGNHKYEATVKFLDIFPDKKVEMTMFRFMDMTDAEENEVYDIIQHMGKETPDDFCQRHQEELYIYELLRRDFPFPVSIYTSAKAKALRFRLMLDAYLGAKLESNPVMYTDANTSRLRLYEKLGENDHKFLKQFIKGFIVALGEPITGNRPDKNEWALATPFTAIMRLYFDNAHRVGETKFWRDLKRKAVRSPIVIRFASLRGKEAQMALHQEMLKAMNKGYKTETYILQKTKTATEEPDEEDDEE